MPGQGSDLGFGQASLEQGAAHAIFAGCFPPWSVVTGDRQLARQAREAGASVSSPEEWRGRLEAAASSEKSVLDKPPEPASADEVAEWEDYFSRGRD